MSITAARIRGLIVREARLRESESLLVYPETPDERIDLAALESATGISRSTLSRVLTGECDRRGGGHWQPSYSFVARLQMWLGLKSDPDTRRRVENSTPVPEIHSGRTADIPYSLS